MTGRIAFAKLSRIGLLVVVGCGGASSESEQKSNAQASDSGSPRASNSFDCHQRCEVKAESCSQLGSNAMCQRVCAVCPTAATLDCLEQSSCAQLSAGACGLLSGEFPVENDCGNSGGKPSAQDAGNTSSTRDAGGATSTQDAAAKPMDQGPNLASSVKVIGRWSAPGKVISALSDDGKTLSSVLYLEAKDVSFSPDTQVGGMTYELDLDGASSSTIDKPSLSSCAKQPSISLSRTSKNVLFSFGGNDMLPATPCQTFAKDVISLGLKVTYKGVPYKIGTRKADTVTIEIRP